MRLTLLIALVVAASACGGNTPEPSTPTGAPTPAVGAGGIEFNDPARLLAMHEAAIRELIEQTLAQARAEIDVRGVRIRVSPNRNRTIQGYGIGGFAPDGFTMDIAIDPAFPEIGELLPERLPLTVAHELHHNARWRGPGYGSTLLESMISEGLADHFAVELLGVPLPPWSRAFPEDRTESFLTRAEPELDSRAFNFDAWFFGIGGDLPRWTGYTLGFRLVSAFQAANPDRSAADLVNTPADAFRPTR